MEYFELSVPTGDGLCSDNDCPCGYPGSTITRGTGYMFISQEVVDFRQDARTLDDLKDKIMWIEKEMNIRSVWSQSAITGILMCEQGARKKGLDLEVSAADAAHWQQTGLVPLRATPLAAIPTPVERNSLQKGKDAHSQQRPEGVRGFEGRKVADEKLRSEKASGDTKNARREIQAKKKSFFVPFSYRKWTITLERWNLYIRNHNNEDVLSIDAQNAEHNIGFQSTWSNYNTVFRGASTTIRLLLNDNDIDLLRAWVDDPADVVQRPKMKKGSGFGFRCY